MAHRINRRDMLLGTAALVAAPATFAQVFPNKPIKLVYTFAAGGSGDGLTRAVAASMSNHLGQQVVVENRTGGAGTVGAQSVWKAPADGYTIMLTTITTMVQYPLVTKDTSFDPVTAMIPIANVAVNPLCLVAHPSVPATDFASFVEWARKQAGGVDVAVSGPTLEVASALLGARTGIKFNTIRYRGGAPALQALLAGEPKVFFDSANGPLIANVKEGKARVIGVTSAEPSPLLPDAVPIAKHLPGFVQDINFAIWSPPGTPAAVNARLADAIAKSMAEPDMREKLFKVGMVHWHHDAEYVKQVTQREAASIKRAMELVPTISYGG